jgi:hypothetical protein
MRISRLASLLAALFALLAGVLPCDVLSAASYCSASERVALKESRSLLNEAQFAEDIRRDGKATVLFNAGLKKQARDELAGARKTFPGNSDAATAIDDGMAALAANESDRLHNAALKLMALAHGDCK